VRSSADFAHAASRIDAGRRLVTRNQESMMNRENNRSHVRFRPALVCGILVATLTLPASAGELRLAKILSDNCVLQQAKPITIWGWAEPGASVEVTLTQDAKMGNKVAPPDASKDDGKRHVRMRYEERNPPQLATQTKAAAADDDGRWSVTFPPAKASFQPTWIIAASGEQKATARNVLIGEVWVCAGQSNMDWSSYHHKDREAPSDDFPGLRYVSWDDSWYEPLDEVRTNINWQECSPSAAERFSAVPYLYGMFLHRYLKVPVGVINVARGGTLGQTWCLRSELDGVDSDILKTILADYDAETAIWDDPRQREQIMAEWRKEVAAKEQEHKKQTAAAKAAGKPEPRLRLPKVPQDPRSGWSPPAGLFNATVMPIRKLAPRGVLYYQGENQAFDRWTVYEDTFPEIPVSFRKAFADDGLFFGCISQPGWGEFGKDPEVSAVVGGYHIVRDIQRRALKDDPLAGMIATYPAGNSYIHPGEKLPVAEWASLWALANVYQAPVVHRANRYTHMKAQNGKVYVFFDSDPIVYERWKHIEKNAFWQVLPQPREGNAPMLGFTIAGEDRRWYPADAKCVWLDDEPCIELSSDLVQNPVAARYGWASWPTGNLVGREQLPVPTFRTDDWPLPIGVRYSEEARQKARAKIEADVQLAEQQALDRKIRQRMIDLPRLESELYLHKNGQGGKGLIQSKIARLQAVLDECENDPWLSNYVRNSELEKQLEATRKAVDSLEKRAAELE
jgi:sialate O-acetylesterase